MRRAAVFSCRCVRVRLLRVLRTFTMRVIFAVFHAHVIFIIAFEVFREARCRLRRLLSARCFTARYSRAEAVPQAAAPMICRARPTAGATIFDALARACVFERLAAVPAAERRAATALPRVMSAPSAAQCRCAYSSVTLFTISFLLL